MSLSLISVPTVGAPHAKSEIVAELASLHEQSTGFWNGFSDEEFYAPLGSAWSPAENVRHLDRSVKPLTQALRLPVPVIWLIWGPARTPSRNYLAVRDAYHRRLADGLTAGRFAPRPEPVPSAPASARRELMARRELRARALAAAIEGWGESDLDRCRLPHPGLGKLTVREMLLFTLYHNLHHVQNVARRFDGVD